MFVSEFFQDQCMHAWAGTAEGELPAWFSAESLAIKRPLIETLLFRDANRFFKNRLINRLI